MNADKLFPDVRPLTNETRADIIKDIELTMLSIVREIAQGNPPTLKLTSGQRDSHETYVRFSLRASRRKLALLVFVVSKIHRLLTTNSMCSRRQLYYERPDLFRTQRQVDELAKYACQLLRRPPWHLNLTATSKGLIFGDLIIQTSDGKTQDCSTEPTGTLVPKDVVGILSLNSPARFILVVEKDTVFQKLLKEGAPRRLGPCLIVTAKGYPDINTRLLIWRLRADLQVPMLALVDADPHGIDIMNTYRFGPTKSPSLLTAPPLPDLRWIGLHPTDIAPLGLLSIPIREGDKKLAASLLRRFNQISDPRTAASLKTQVEEILKTGKKSEIESLATCSANYLTDVYLPRKISCSEYI